MSIFELSRRVETAYIHTRALNVLVVFVAWPTSTNLYKPDTRYSNRPDAHETHWQLTGAAIELVQFVAHTTTGFWCAAGRLIWQSSCKCSGRFDDCTTVKSCRPYMVHNSPSVPNPVFQYEQHWIIKLRHRSCTAAKIYICFSPRAGSGWDEHHGLPKWQMLVRSTCAPEEGKQNVVRAILPASNYGMISASPGRSDESWYQVSMLFNDGGDTPNKNHNIWSHWQCRQQARKSLYRYHKYMPQGHRLRSLL